MIRVTQADFSYPGAIRPALSGIDLEIGDGEYVAFLGANGSGKSTLARLLNGLEVPHSGWVEVDGLDTRRDGLLVRQRLQLVFQNPEEQAVGLTVGEDLAFGLANLGVAREDFSRRIDEALTAVGWTVSTDSPVHRLSSGEKQKLALASVLVLEPRHLVLDEPTAFLDPRSRQEFLASLHRARQHRGFTLIHITHRLEDVLEAGRWLVFAAGRLEGDRSPEEWAQAPTFLQSRGVEPPFSHRLRDALKLSGVEVVS